MTDNQKPEPVRSSDRQSRRRSRTRLALLHAAQAVMGEKGSSATTIADITEAADVGLGSFYNHFKSKDDILEAAARDALARNGDAIDSRLKNIEDPVIAMATAWFESLSYGLENPRLGRFVTRGGAMRIIEDVLTNRLIRDLQIGMRSGHFKLKDMQATAALITGAQSNAMQAIFDGRLEATSIPEILAQCLMMLGITYDDAWATSLKVTAGAGKT